mmetsp:Transcript_14112/g.27035  ORF Transcript_14112/g.27035 Transcript_14112/m.27035 type:complete len:257 (+) Transcript_14112:92-862(+)
MNTALHYHIQHPIMADPNWELGGGISESMEIAFLVCYAVFAIVAVFFGNVAALKPLRLMTTFCHEFGHATVCWLTCGSVDQIQIQQNEGGVTSYKGGCRILIVPAGYIGAAFTGASCVALSGSRIGATIVCAAMTLALLIALCFQPNKLAIYMSLCFSVINIGVILVDYLVFDPFIQFVALFYGVFIGWLAVRDIFDDLIGRTVAESDAVSCSKLIPCCFPKCAGVQFWLISFAFQGMGLYMGLVWLLSENEENNN